MNKLFTKVATLSVGLAMAIGVGVAVGGREAKEVKAAPGSTISDTITNSDTKSLIGSTGSTAWTDITVTKNATYQIHTMGGVGTNYAFRWNKNGYLYVSANPGSNYKIKSITIAAAAKSVDIYGSATAYSGKASATKDGSLTTSTSGAEYTYNTKYLYAAINGKDSSTEITSITFTWEEQAVASTYSVNYDANGGSNAPENVSGISAESAASYSLANKGSLSREGFEADGWATSANGAKVYDFGQTVNLVNVSTNKVLNLFAHWNKIETPNKIIFANEGLTDTRQYSVFGTSADPDGEDPTVDRSYMNFTVEFTGGGNDGKYYNTGTGVRTYKNGGAITITAKNSQKLGSIVFTWDGSYKPSSSKSSVDSGEFNEAYTEWTGDVNSVTITYTSNGENDSPWRLKSVEVTIVTVKVNSITLSPSSLNVLSTDETDHTITVTVGPSEAANKAVTISSNNTTVATVSKDSLSGSGTFTVTGKKATSGTQTVTVSATDGSGVTATLTLTAVDASTPVLTSITVDQTGLVHTTQYVGNAFDPDGLAFTPVYTVPNPDPDVITASDFTWSTLTAGQNVIGTYKDNTSIKVTIDQVTVKNDELVVTITGNALTNPNFLKSASWNHDGITASAAYESGASYSGSITWSYDPATPSEMGVTASGTLEITATAGTVSKSVEVTVSVTKGREVITERVDTIDNAFTIDKDSQNYYDWTNTGTLSGITYVGQSAGKGLSVQLRTTNSNSGIVTTSEHGYVKSIKFVYDAQTTIDRTIDVYGKSSAYEAATDLYDAETQGTSLGSVTGQGDDEKTLTITGSYEYIGIRSNSGAVFLSEIVITWSYVHSSSDVTAVDNFVSSKMHLDYDNGGTIGSEGGNGSCAGYYDKNGETGAKYAFSQLTTVQKEIILKSTSVYGTVGSHEYKYNEIKDRLSEWARINGDTFNSETGAFSAIRNPLIVELSGNSATLIIIVASIVSLTAIGGYFLFKKKKQN